MMFEINEYDNSIERTCKCGYKEEIGFHYLHFERELDEDKLNSHFVEKCPRCQIYYDIILDADESDNGEEIVVHITNYREKECFIDHLVDKGFAIKRL